VLRAQQLVQRIVRRLVRQQLRADDHLSQLLGNRGLLQRLLLHPRDLPCGQLRHDFVVRHSD
jgi:hypothetical protein